jgi:hypothetical protein
MPLNYPTKPDGSTLSKSEKDLFRVSSKYFNITTPSTWTFKGYIKFIDKILKNKPISILEFFYETYLFELLKESKISKSFYETYLLNQLKESKITTETYIAKVEELRVSIFKIVILIQCL